MVSRQDKKYCIFKDTCEKEKCPYDGCRDWHTMEYMLRYSNIPLSKQKPHPMIPDNVDIEAFEQLSDIQYDIVKFTKNGGLLYIYSNNFGNGKTTWAIKMMLEFFNKIKSSTMMKVRGVFVNVPKFLTKSKLIISDPDPDFDELRNNLFKADLAVFDDIGTSELSNYDYTTLLSFIDSRIFDEKGNIFTGNVPPNELSKFVGGRLASRMSAGIHIELKGKDMRNGTASMS